MRVPAVCLAAYLCACAGLAACGDRRAEPTARDSNGPSAATASAAPRSNTRPPPADAITVAEVQRQVDAEPDALRDRKLTVSGVVAKTGRQVAVDAKTFYVKVVRSEGESKPAVYCDLGKNEPAGIAAGTPIVVKGTARVQPRRAGDGGVGYGVELRDCTIL
jgi:hypothetical protein